MSVKALRSIALLLISVCIIICIPAQAVIADSAEAAIELSDEERQFISDHGKFRVGFVQDRIPVSFSDDDGNLAGISRYIFDRVAELCGLDFEYIPLPSGSITYDFLTENRLDLVTSVEFNRENLNARGILISEPYFSGRKVVVAREDLDFSCSANLSIAVCNGSQTIRKVLGETYPNFDIVDYDSIEDCFEAVKDGEADLMMQNQFVVEYWIAKPAYEGLKVIPVLGLADELCFSAVVSFDGSTPAPPEEDGRMLINILNRAIESMSEDEIGTFTIQAIMENQYSYSFTDFLYRYRLSFALLALAALVIITLATLLIRQRVRSLAAQSDAKAKGQFLSAMSHEIRTPLNGLVGLNYLISQKSDDKERVEGYLKQSASTAKYLLRLVDDLLDMSRLHDNSETLVYENVDLQLLLSTAASLVEGSMSDKALDFRMESSLLQRWIIGDEARIQQIILNLLDNARKFTPEGGKVILRAGQHFLTGGLVETKIEVEDTGRGMSEQFQKRVFDSFAQERESVSKGNEGAGLGLPISRNLARLMGGDITFVSVQGSGSTFTFSFTAKPAKDVLESDFAAEQRSERDKPRVLIAEDNELNAEIMLELLDSFGFEAELAMDGQEAVEMFKASEPNYFGVILMDLLMPRMDGYEAAAAIRALDREDAKNVCIIACTANKLSYEQSRMEKSGMDDFVSKPIDMEDLIKKMMARIHKS